MKLRSASVWARAGAMVWALAGCQASGESIEGADLCERLAAQVCAAQASCCRPATDAPDAAQDSASRADASDAAFDARAPDAGARVDGGSMRDGGLDGGDSMAAVVPPQSCEGAQREACERVLGVMARDERLGYVPARGAALVAAVRAAAERCEALPSPSQARGLFAGTAPERSSCSPASSAPSALATAQASCREETTCRVSLRSDGTLLGSCERRAGGDDGCSHPLDCPSSQYCELALDWQPSQWGRCQTPRANGWECSDDLRCESGYCGLDGRCAARPADGFCLDRTYRALILAERPEAHYGFDRSPSDSTGRASAAVVNGGAMFAADGAFGERGSLALDGTSGWASVALPTAMATDSAMSVELWFRAPVVTGRAPLLEFFSSADGPGFSLGIEGGRVTADFASLSGSARRVSSDASALAADRWTHVVATWNGAAGRLFVNGVQVAQSSAAELDRRGELRVGYAAPAMTGATPLYLRGAIDELAVYRRALSATAVAQHYRAAVQGSVSVASSLYRWLD